jgi:hypothetical protein
MQQCLIPIRLGNCKARALLDSGSTISTIPKLHISNMELVNFIET